MASGRHEHRRILEEFAQQNGWTIEQRNNTRLKITHPHFETVFSSSNPKDGNASKQVLRDLKQAMSDAGFNQVTEPKPPKTYGNPFPDQPKTTNLMRRERRAERLEKMAIDI